MTDQLSPVDLSSFLNDKESQQSKDDCRRIAQTLRDTSCLVIRDPRVSEIENSNFIDMMEKYYEQPLEEKMKDVHPELHYQLGATPEFVEVPRDHQEKINNLIHPNEAQVPKGADPKWRYFWRIGERPTKTQFQELNSEPVIPKAFPQWTEVMNRWGNLMMQSIRTVAEMVAIGLDLPSNTFLDVLNCGPHLLAPTGSDLGRYNELKRIFAGYHYDLNFLTIHGKSRFPGLFIWMRDGTRAPVKVPDGCLLIQAGKQMEWLTGGEIAAGFHEVIVSDETVAAIERARAAGKSLWRVSSTLFSNVASDHLLEPIGRFKNAATAQRYPSLLTGHQVEEELRMIKLAAPQ
ncbi:hypothetical protein PROFUN_15738 [Planoprotostelium fungivorum]|uniref:Isopenicillin N synthase-like Fe(2+) 2OG dioxygenase domain-containing protein n=1 Tax=Planoprotostelium fungivorum TaxID=1890364 RepID=A0A2P6MUS8_9EUKA|nr:hypothetical protein PROFUN_15738 [Planoprotostelium fungivorum]